MMRYQRCVWLIARRVIPYKYKLLWFYNIVICYCFCLRAVGYSDSVNYNVKISPSSALMCCYA